MGRTMLYKSIHTTIYDYVEPVSLCHNVFHLAARSGSWQTRRSSELRISPSPSVMTERTDFFGNTATFATIEEPHRELSVIAVNVAEITPVSPPMVELTPPWEAVREQLRTDVGVDVLAASQLVFDSRYVPTGDRLAAYAAPSFPPGRPILEAVLDLTARIHADFRYDPSATTIATPIKEVLEQRHGVCQDFAHLQIGCLRSLGLAARYVSGYLVNTPPAGRPRPSAPRSLMPGSRSFAPASAGSTSTRRTTKSPTTTTSSWPGAATTTTSAPSKASSSAAASKRSR